MENFESLSHVRWDCKYHVVFILKYLRKVIDGKLRSLIGRIVRDLCQQKVVEVLEGHTMAGNIHGCLKIPLKYAVSYIIEFVKGKSAIRVHRELLKERRMTGLHFWASGYWVSAAGRDEVAVRRNIRELENWNKGNYSINSNVTINQPQWGFPHANAPLCGVSQGHGLWPWLISSTDRRKLNQNLNSVREVERCIEYASRIGELQG